MLGREEVFINTLACDVEVLRTVLIAVLFRLAEARPEILADLKSGVLTGLEQFGLDNPRTQENERVRQLILERGRAFFADVEKALGQPQTNPNPSRPN